MNLKLKSAFSFLRNAAIGLFYHHKPVFPGPGVYALDYGAKADDGIYEKFSYLPKLSIVVPSYNQGQFLERTLISILNQNYPKLELIVIDGGSVDHSVEIIKKHERDISSWVSEKDKGQGNAINKGFDRASGELFGWLNSDDCYTYGSFYELIKYVNHYPGADFFYGDSLVTDSDDVILRYWSANLVLDRYLKFGGLIASHTAFWRAKIHQPLCEELNCNIDGELWMRLVKSRKRKYVSFPLGASRIHPDSKSSAQKWLNKWQADEVYLAKKYGLPPGKRSYIRYEYNYFQELFHLVKKPWFPGHGLLKLPFTKKTDV